MLSLYLVRHGQTDLSLQNRFCGALDVPLNATGLSMAEALAERLEREKWEAIYCSPLERARMTVAPTACRVGLTPILEDGLREISYGSWEGRPETEVETAEPE